MAPLSNWILPGHRTADHVLTLRTRTDKHVSYRKNQFMHVLLILNNESV